MPKIKNWSKISKYQIPNGFIMAWENDKTGEIVAVTSKIPNDGYYVEKWDSKDDFGISAGYSLDFDMHREYARKLAVMHLRENPSGFEE